MENIITAKNFQKPTEEPKATQIVKFTNFSNEDFTWTLNKISYTFPAHSVKFMEIGVANHFAKHLVNRELLKRGRQNDTSPKKKEENPFFMELYNQCIEPVDSHGEPMDETKARQEAIDMTMKEKEGANMSSNIDPKPSKGSKGKVAEGIKVPPPNKKEEKKEEGEFEELESDIGQD